MGGDEKEQSYHNVLTLNRYNKIYMEEFKEEDIEIMNINSNVKKCNLYLQ
jgi:hypothetical protein